jgi:adenine-specific DNA-methyltransferase
VPKTLEEYTKDELIEVIKNLKRRKKFGLVWEDKPEEVVRLVETELPVIEEVPERAVEKLKDAPTNFIIEGDNYHSLSVLNYTHTDKVDVIYADPPYNTGSNTWVYNNRIVDSSDTYRHSKWLSFMRVRLVLAKQLLKDTGIITVTIDDYELFTLGMLMDEIFGEENKVGVLAVENNPRGRTANRFYATSHEYYVVYAKNAKLATISNLPLTKEQKKVFKYEDEISPYRLRGMRKSGADSRRKDRPKQFYTIYINPETLQGSLEKQDGWDEVLPIDNTGSERVWIIGTERCKEFLEDGTIIINKAKGDGYSLFVKDRIKAGRKARTVWVDPRYDTSSHGATLLLNMFGEKVFDYPKSLWAVRDFLYTAAGENKEAVILDFFAGSGTTGHAVLELNKEDGGKRQFIICTNNENGIAENVTYPRVKNVIDGYSKYEGIKSNLRYFKTALVSKKQTDDQTRIELVARSTDMICLREDAFEKIIETKLFKVFAHVDYYAAILFEAEAIVLLKDALAKLKDDKPVHIYVFSLSNDTYESDFVDLEREHELRPIPESILEVYRRIHKAQGEELRS